MLSTNIGDVLVTFTPKDQICYLNMTASYTAVLNAVSSALNVDVCTDVCLFELQVVGVDLTTERITVIELPVTLSCL